MSIQIQILFMQKIADDKETVLFSQSLKKEGIDYLLYVNDDVYQDGLKVTYTQSQNIIIHGEKGIFPKYDYELKRKVFSCNDYFEEYGSIYKSILAHLIKSMFLLLEYIFLKKVKNQQ